MKTFSESERREIEERIAAATGMEFAGARPEYFLPTIGGCISTSRLECKQHKTCGPFVQLAIGFGPTAQHSVLVNMVILN